MRTDYQRTPLWKRTLGVTSAGEHQADVDRLRNAYEDFRARVEVLAEEIKISMPMFTDHGIEHIDSLWDTASLLIGDDFPINPAEAFVLGGSFLLHDLAMGLAAFPEGADGLRRDRTFVAALEAEAVPESASEEERSAAADRALIAALRLNHAHQAARLVDQEFETSGGDRIRLLPHDDLRLAFGEDIGRIAQSHWCSVEELKSFVSNRHGTDGSLPAAWEIDPLKLACILRLADATHIDSRRAPLMLHAFRPQQGVSKDHWVFQLRLNRPIVRNGRLEYSSNRAFPETESRAWWLAHDTLFMIDEELRKVEALALDVGLPTFSASSVAGVSTPQRLAELVRTVGWTPIDASVRVTNVGGIVENLGGMQLYGDAPMIAVRELVANAADAVKLVGAYTGGPTPPVHIRLYQHGGRDWLEVVDNGIGMDRQQMTSSLLDFGSSQWRASLQDPELAQLPKGAFTPRGKYGIGFFSVFMIADRVEVVSLRYLRGSADTAMLVFEDGLEGRPLFREVPAGERLTKHGTVVRVRLKHPPLSENGLLETDAVESSVTQMLRDRLVELCALSDVDIQFTGPDHVDAHTVATGDEWMRMDAGDLFDRIYATDLKNPLQHEINAAWRQYFVDNERQLLDQSGGVVGRAVLASGLEADTVRDVWWWPSPSAKVYVGGLRGDFIWNCLGAFVGKPLKADRNSAFPVASTDELLKWATTQLHLLTEKREASATTRYGAAELGRSVGVELPDMPCGILATGELTPGGLPDWLAKHESIFIVGLAEVNVFQDEGGAPLFRERKRGRELKIPENLVFMRLWHERFFPEEIEKPEKDSRFGEYGSISANEWNPRAWWYHHGRVGSTALLLEAVMEVWGLSPQEVAENFHRLFLTKGSDDRIPVEARDHDEVVLVEGFRLSRRSA